MKTIKYKQPRSTNKAKPDIALFCREAGYRDVSARPPFGGSVGKFLCKTATVARLVTNLHKGDVLIIQYPYKKYYKTLCRIARMKGARTITLIHDLGAFRRKKLTPAEENARLSQTDCIIVHSRAMAQWLADHGCRVPMVVLDIFDYRSGAAFKPRHTTGAAPTRIVYAGSLGERKNRFLYAFPPLIPSCIIAVCGRGLDEDKVSNPDGNFIYRGFVPSEQFFDSPDGDWGLVWDGDLTDCCGGVWGEYLRINNPHKASFYIRSSIPVIVWKHSAMAPFITVNHLGIAVESLADLETLLPQITPEQYGAYAAACADFARRLDEGHFFRRAVAKSLDILYPPKHPEK